MLNLISKYWARCGGFMSVIIVFYVLFFSNNLSYLESLLWIHFATLLIHQFEEYVYPGGFKDFFNDKIYNKTPIIKHQLNDKGIILVNIVLGWSAYFYSAFHSDKYLWLAVGLTGITILNGIMHTMMFIIHKKYNPGFYSGILLFIPFGSYLLFTLLNDPSKSLIVSGFTVFAIGTILIPISIFITNKIRD